MLAMPVMAKRYLRRQSKYLSREASLEVIEYASELVECRNGDGVTEKNVIEISTPLYGMILYDCPLLSGGEALNKESVYSKV